LVALTGDEPVIALPTTPLWTLWRLGRLRWSTIGGSADAQLCLQLHTPSVEAAGQDPETPWPLGLPFDGGR